VLEKVELEGEIFEKILTLMNEVGENVDGSMYSVFFNTLTEKIAFKDHQIFETKLKTILRTNVLKSTKVTFSNLSLGF
jgi:hypothetical protein